MSDLPRRQLVAYVLAGLVLVLAGARWVRASTPSSSAAPVPAAGAKPAAAGALRVEHDDGGAMVVYVAGAVHRPGVYRLPAGARVEAAVRRAGGATRSADLDALNLAAKLDDGRQVVVPRRGAAAAGDAASTAAGAAGGPATPVNLNTATADQLATLDGVGPAMAAKIIAYRQEHGGFRSVDELDQVSGIGPKRLAALRDHVSA